MTPPTILVVDLGAQYVQLIARRVREQHVHSVIVPPTITADEVRSHRAVGLILSGGPASVYEAGAPKLSQNLLDLNLPTLGICYGMQLGCQMLGGNVSAGRSGEFGRTHLSVTRQDALTAHLPPSAIVWMSHGDIVDRLSSDFIELARTDHCPYAAVRHQSRPFYGVQFHPEVTHTPCGEQIFRNFVYDICGCAGDWQVGNFSRDIIESIRERVGRTARVICGLSGGVDSSVAALLIHKAIGDRLTCIFVDNGLLRNREVEIVSATFREHFHMDLRVVDAADGFLQLLDGVVDPQQKRLTIGHEFIEVFKREAKLIPGVEFLAQGTVYPDVIESGKSVGGHTAGIKLHHNVGGLPAELGFKLLEPLRDLFKDEVRRVGEHLGLPEQIVWRHPFPGPGLAVRIIGAVTRPRLDMLRMADDIVLEEIQAAGWYRKVAQGFAVLLPVSTVGVMGDGRSYQDQHIIAVRLVESADFMTADWVRLDQEVLARISTRIINEVRGVNRVVYDISTKPPATIEWE